MLTDTKAGRVSSLTAKTRSWRVRALNAFLTVAAVAAFPLIVIFCIEQIPFPNQWPLASLIVAIYLLVIGLAVLRRVNFYIRVWCTLTLGYLLSVLTLARGGLVGDGRLYLLALPLLAFVLVDWRASVTMASLCVATFAVFAVLAQLGVLADWLVLKENTLQLIYWIDGGLALAVTMAVLMVLQRHYSHLYRSTALESVRLYEESERLRGFNQSIVDGMQEGLLVEDTSGRITFANPRAAELLGYLPEELVGQHHRKFVAPEYADKVAEETAKRPDNIAGRYEAAILTREGQRIPVLVSALPIMEEARFAGVLIVFIDITEQKRTEAELEHHRLHLEDLVRERATELAETNERLRREIAERRHVEELLTQEERTFYAVLQHALYGVILIDQDEECLYINPEFTAITGYTLDDVPTMADWFQQAYPDPQYRRAVIESWQGDTVHRASKIFRVTCKEGDVKQVEFRSTLLGSNRAVLMLCDVTERIQAEEALKEHSRLLTLLNQAGRALTSTLDLDEVLGTLLSEIRHLLDVVGASVWLIDSQTQELYCRQATGPKSDVVRDWRLKPGEGIAGHVAQHGKSLIVDDIWADDRHYERLDRRTGLDLRSILTVPLRVKDVVIGVLQVVDSRYDRFSKFDQTLVESLAAAAAIAIENAKLYEQARQDAETKSILLREVNHRVKNILTAIVGLLYTEQRHAAADKRAAYQPMLQNLITRVQGVAAAQSMLSKSEWSPVLLSDLVAKVVHSALRALPYGKTADVQVDQSSVRVTAEQAHNLALVINELATNVVKHGFKGRHTVKIAVDIAREDGMIRLEIRNDGSEFPEDVLQMERYNTGFDLAQNILHRNLGGELGLHNDHGAVAVIHFKSEVEERE